MRLLIFILSLLSLIGCTNSNKKPIQDKKFIPFFQKSRLVDTNFIQKVKLNDIIVCNSTITDLKKLGYNPKLTPKSEIDSLIAAINWQKGSYYTDKPKNLVFSTYDNSELLSSIFLTHDFKGTLRELSIPDFSKLMVRDVMAYFKDLDWSTTGVSDYWIFGNDTINFYIKIDKSIPRFPLNEKFYEDKHPVLAKVQYLCHKVYGEKHGKNDTVMQKPLYSSLTDTHLNYYLLRRKPGVGTTIREITSTGKKTVMEEIRIGKWVTYNPDHSIKNIEYFNNGELVTIEK